MSVSEDAARLRAMADFQMALAAVERAKNELFEAEGQCAAILGSHPALADISGPIAQARQLGDQFAEAIHVVAGAVTGVADTIMRGGS